MRESGSNIYEVWDLIYNCIRLADDYFSAAVALLSLQRGFDSVVVVVVSLIIRAAYAWRNQFC